MKFCAERFSTGKNKPAPKTDIFRSDFGSERYLPVIQKLDVDSIEFYGMYPLPMISHSPEFPFSLLPKPIEWLLTRLFEGTLFFRKTVFKKSLHRSNPWTCSEKVGQAFLVAYRKKGNK
jgi:hypothetical protein